MFRPKPDIAGFILAFVILALGHTRLLLTVAMMIQGFGMGLAGPAFMAGASLAVSQQEQGAVAGVAGSCGPLGFTLGPLLGGALYQVAPALPYAFAAGVYVVLLVFMQWIGRRVVEHHPPPVAEAVAAPVVATVAAPVVATVAAPVVATVAEPGVATVAAPGGASGAAPGGAGVAAPAASDTT